MPFIQVDFIQGFQHAHPSSPEFVAAWTVSFEIGVHHYSFRIEAAKLGELGLDGICPEQGVPLPPDDIAHFLKFDNAINELDARSAFARMPPDHRLTISEIRRLAQILAQAIEAFCLQYRPSLLIGIPNDAKLALWYRHLRRGAVLDGHLLDVRSTAYHSHDILLIQRL